MKFDWEEHYKNGGQSGDPLDYAKSREWKLELLSRHYTMDKDSIIDVACGDLQFWSGKPPLNYTGVDISSTIIDRHKRMFTDRNFICSDAGTLLNIKADVVICFDMLWHIIDDNEYVKVLENIKRYSDKYIFIFTWNSNPLSIISYIMEWLVRSGGRTKYQKYRNYRAISDPIFIPNFKLIEVHTNDVWKFGSMYVYERV